MSIPSQWAAISSISEKIGCTAETLRKWVRQAERDSGERAGLTTQERTRLKELERENRELRRANEILKKGVRVFRPGGARPPTAEMTSFIDDHRAEYGVEPICAVLPIAPSTYYEQKACEADPSRRSLRAQHDEELKVEVRRVWDAEPLGLRGQEGLEAAEARGLQGGSMYGRAPHGGAGPGGGDPRPALQGHHDLR
jgi:putative transposase